ncbi:SdpI family protein [[Eubacterium] rectale]|nr:SdpI family protein [Agathobacter rectalis]
MKQNNTIGIRIVLTLQDEENWNATHSFSGRIWGTSGILCMLCILHLIKSVSKEA